MSPIMTSDRGKRKGFIRLVSKTRKSVSGTVLDQKYFHFFSLLTLADVRVLAGVLRPHMQARSGYWAVVYGRSMLVHCFCRLRAATPVFAAELQW